MGSVDGSRDLITGLFRDMHEYPFPVWKDKTIAQKSKLHILHKVGLGAEQQPPPGLQHRKCSVLAGADGRRATGGPYRTSPQRQPLIRDLTVIP